MYHLQNFQNIQNLFDSGKDVGRFARAELEEDESRHAIGAGGVDLSADFVEREAFGRNTDARKNPLRSTELLGLPFIGERLPSLGEKFHFRCPLFPDLLNMERLKAAAQEETPAAPADAQ